MYSLGRPSGCREKDQKTQQVTEIYTTLNEYTRIKTMEDWIHRSPYLHQDRPADVVHADGAASFFYVVA